MMKSVGPTQWQRKFFQTVDNGESHPEVLHNNKRKRVHANGLDPVCTMIKPRFTVTAGAPLDPEDTRVDGDGVGCTPIDGDLQDEGNSWRAARLQAVVARGGNGHRSRPAEDGRVCCGDDPGRPDGARAQRLPGKNGPKR